jgi:hypothetical protein
MSRSRDENKDGGGINDLYRKWRHDMQIPLINMRINLIDM